MKFKDGIIIFVEENAVYYEVKDDKIIGKIDVLDFYAEESNRCKKHMIFLADEVNNWEQMKREYNDRLVKEKLEEEHMKRKQEIINQRTSVLRTNINNYVAANVEQFDVVDIEIMTKFFNDLIRQLEERRHYLVEKGKEDFKKAVVEDKPEIETNLNAKDNTKKNSNINNTQDKSQTINDVLNEYDINIAETFMITPMIRKALLNLLIKDN